jgi:hypothetical protein
MHRLLTALLFAVPFAASAVAPSDIQAPVLITRIDCHIVIDKAGHIADYQSKTPLAAPLAERVRDMVMAVRFEPVEVDGRIVNAETDMRVAITAERLDDGGLKLALDNVSFPQAKRVPKLLPDQPTATHKVTPRFPSEALRLGANADLLAVVRFGPDGNVVDAAVEQAALVHARARPADAAPVLTLFERATLQALRQWKVDPAGMPADSRVANGFVAYIPVTFRLGGRNGEMPAETKPGEWSLETRTTRRVPAWVTVAGQAPQPGVADLADGEMAGLNTRFRLAAPLDAAGS